MADFSISFTPTGAQKEGAALAGGPQVSLTHIVFGGNTTSLPSDEVARVPIESSYVDVDGHFVVQGRLPQSEGGFWVGHVGLIDADGDLIAQGTTPEFEKPAPEDTGDFEYIVRIRLVVQSTECFTVVYDTSGFASVEYVDLAIADLQGYFDSQVNQAQTLYDNTVTLVTQASLAADSAQDSAAEAAASEIAAQNAADSASADADFVAAAVVSVSADATTAQNAAAEAVAAAEAAYRDSDYGVFVPEIALPDDVVAAFPMQYNMEIPVDWADSVAHLLTASAAGVTFDIKVDGSPVGTITFAPAANVGVFSSIALTPVAAGSLLTIETGGTLTADFADLTVILKLERTS